MFFPSYITAVNEIAKISSKEGGGKIFHFLSTHSAPKWVFLSPKSANIGRQCSENKKMVSGYHLHIFQLVMTLPLCSLDIITVLILSVEDLQTIISV